VEKYGTARQARGGNKMLRRKGAVFSWRISMARIPIIFNL